MVLRKVSNWDRDYVEGKHYAVAQIEAEAEHLHLIIKVKEASSKKKDNAEVEE